MWNIKQAKFDLDAAYFTQFETCVVADISQATGAKWLHRNILKPTRSGRSKRGGHLFSALNIFEAKTTNALVKHLAIPPSEAAKIAMLVAKGDWKSRVIRETPAPLSIFLVITRTDDCWEYIESLGPPSLDDLNKPTVAVLAAARDLTAVYEQCWKILNDSERATVQSDRT